MSAATRRTVTRWLAVGAAALACGCGDPLLSVSAYQSPLITIAGHLNPFPEAGTVDLRVGVVWVDPLGIGDDVPAPADTSRLEMSDADFQLSLFAPPPEAAVYDLRDSTGAVVLARLAFGELVVFDDRDGDGTFHVEPAAAGGEIVAPDLYRGASATLVMTYVVTPLQAPATVLPELHGLLATTPGYHLGYVDCSAPDAPSTSTYGDPSTVVVEMHVDGDATTDLPFVRTCLRSHPVTAPPTPGT
jgi:hypothetical protein